MTTELPNDPLSKRWFSIDIMKGMIMIFMALDHASAMVARVHFMEVWGFPFSGYPDGLWWLTRFVSHLCAPGFFLLMGVGMHLYYAKREKDNTPISRVRTYFLKRGLVILFLMIFLEFPAWGLAEAFSNVQQAMQFPGGGFSGFFIPTTVLFGLAFSMILGAFVLRWSNWMLLLTSILCFAGTYAYVWNADHASSFSVLEHLFLVPGASPGAMVIYPILPWFGITSLGLLTARLMQKDRTRAIRILFNTSIWLLAGFVLTRYLNFGNFQHDSYHSWIEFLTIVKYPPGISFLSITLALLLLGIVIFERVSETSRIFRIIAVYGRSPMFFYIMHLYIYALLGIFFPDGSSRVLFYVLWLVGLIPLYFACRWFYDFKRQRTPKSIWKFI